MWLPPPRLPTFTRQPPSLSMRSCVTSVADCEASASTVSGTGAPPKRICIRVNQPGPDAAASGGAASVISGCAATRSAS